jgi:hypothetical protein
MEPFLIKKGVFGIRNDNLVFIEFKNTNQSIQVIFKDSMQKKNILRKIDFCCQIDGRFVIKNKEKVFLIQEILFFDN